MDKSKLLVISRPPAKDFVSWRSRAGWLLVIIIIIAAFFRLYNITQTPPGLYPDEAMNGNNGLEAIVTGPPAGGLKIFYPENNGREGLFINIQAASIAIFGNEPWALRIVSAIFGILTILGIFFLAKVLFKKNSVALLSSFLAATSFWHINFSRIGFRAIMAPFFLTWALYFLIKSFEHWGTKKAVIAGIFYGLGFYSYIAFRATPLLILAIFIYWFLTFKDLRKEIVKKFFVFTITALIVFTPLGWYFINHPADFLGRTSQISVFNSQTPFKDLSLNTIKTLGMFNFAGDWNWRHNFSGQPELYWPVGIMFLVGFVIGLYYLFKKHVFVWDRFSFLVLFSWFIVASLPIVISNEGLPHALRAIILIPIVFILAGYGGVLIYEKFKKIFPNKFFLLATRYLLLAAIIISTYQTYFIKWANNPNTAGAFAKDYFDIGKQLNSLPRELPKYVIVQANGADVRGIPMPSQTTMFITDTFTPEKQKEKNIFYVLPQDAYKIPPGAYTVVIK